MGGMAAKDYSGTPLGKKLGAKAGVVVLFTTSRAELERRFKTLKSTLAAGLVDNKSASIDERWRAIRFVYRLEDR